MPTFRDDLAKVGKRILETVEERTGREVISTEERQLLESDRSERRQLERTLDYIGFRLWNYQPGTPGSPFAAELRPQVRLWAAQQARTMWVEDPMVGQMVDLYLSFVFGRGVPRPQAHDQEVQQHLDATWDDPSNQRVLTSYGPLLEKGIDLSIQSNVFFKFFDDGQDGMVRVSLERFEDVEDVIRHDELAAPGKGDRFRILYYKSRERRVRYQFSDGTRQAIGAQQDPLGAPRTVYFEAWDAFDADDPVMAAQDDGLTRPPADRVRPGKIVHLAVNKTSEMAFGVPRLRRVLNWASAYNEMLISFRDRMKAMSSIYMQATAKGGQRDLERLAMMAQGRTSAFSASAAPDGVEGRPVGPRGPGILATNESLQYQPFKIDSTAGDVSAAAPVMRGQMTGPWPDHYVSGIAEGALAGAQSMELPTLLYIYREQEVWASVLRLLGRASVEKAVEMGDISEWREPTASEFEQIAAAEEAGEEPPFELNADGLIRRDLSFDLTLPDPLKRAMLDIVSAVQQTAVTIDPNGQNPEVTRWAFATVLRDAFDVEDPMRIVDQVLPRQRKPTPAEQAADSAPAPAVGADGQPLPAEGAVGPDGERHTADNPMGAPIASPQPEDRKVTEAAADLLAGVLSVNGNGNE
jgi:hypothetical protein